MKKITWKNPNKMLIETGHKTFDAQCVCVSTGNVIAPTQRSTYIRPITETECNGFVRPPGHLRDFDFDSDLVKQLPRHIFKKLKELTETQKVIIYQFFHWRGSERVIHGYAITSPQHAPLFDWTTGPTYKSWGVMEEVLKYITN